VLCLAAAPPACSTKIRIKTRLNNEVKSYVK
jgi:hypothetical protein